MKGQIINEIKNYEEQIAQLQAHVNNLKIKLADIVMKEETQEYIVGIRFYKTSKVYDYILSRKKCETDEEIKKEHLESVKPGCKVLVMSTIYNELQQVEVVRVVKKTKDEFEFDYKPAWLVC